MRRNYKKLGPAERPPRLIRVIDELGHLHLEGRRSPRLEEDLLELVNDEAQVVLATLWAADLARLSNLLKSREIRNAAIDAALKRSDLTAAEGLELLKAITESLADLERVALLQEQQKREARFRR
jgi:hypothetical protein